MSLPPFLTDDEIAAMTRPLKQGAARIKYLRDTLGLPVRARPDGQPLVWRSDWESRQQGHDGKMTDTAIAMASRVFQGIAGVYFLVKDGQVVYVGQSGNVYARLEKHRAKVDFDLWHFLHVPNKTERLQLERAYIRSLKPALNYGEPRCS